MSAIVIERRIHLGTVAAARHGGHRTVIRAGEGPNMPPPPSLPAKVPRVARLMALAIRCQDLIRSGAVRDATELARLAHVTQPRMTQILNLTLLAPDIQEAILLAEPARHSCLGEHHLRQVAKRVRWDEQRLAWGVLQGQFAAAGAGKATSMSEGKSFAFKGRRTTHRRHGSAQAALSVTRHSSD